MVEPEHLSYSAQRLAFRSASLSRVGSCLTFYKNIMKRPKRIAVIGWFLVFWNLILILARIPQALYALDMPIPVALLYALSPTRVFFIAIGVAILLQRNWARLTYIFIAPIQLGVNLIAGCYRIGIENVYDRIPSIIVTVTFVSLLLSRSAKEWFNHTCQNPLALTPSEELKEGTPTHSLFERAEGALTLFRTLMETLEIRLETKHPQLLIAPEWQHFIMTGTIAGCVSLALRLHFDVSEEIRTPIELKMRERLQTQYPQSEKLYEDCYRFVTESLIDIPRSERHNFIFPLIAIWVITSITAGDELENQEHIVAELAYVYQNETLEYWNPKNSS